MRTAVWETAPQIALRDCAKEAVGEGQYMWFWWRGVSYNQALILQKVFWSWGAVVTMKGFSAFLDTRMWRTDSFAFSTEKNAQCTSWGLSFIWGNMRTAVWETAPQIALRNCSKEMGLGVGGTVYMWFWQRGSTCNQAHIFCWSHEASTSHKKLSSPWF